MSIERVAKLAKVSTATVSRVMNGHDAVSAENVKRVKEAMKKLKYTPRAVRPGPKARVAKERRAGAEKGVLALILAGRSSELLRLPHVARLTRSMTSAANELGLGLMVMEMNDPMTPPRPLRDRAVDGVMILSWPADLEPWLKAISPLPAVLCGGEPMADLPADIVCVNNAAITRMAVDYLAGKGCRQLAFLNHNPRHLALAARRREFDRHVRALGISGVSFECSPATEETEEALWQPGRLRTGMAEVLDRALSGPRPDGIFVPTDQQMSVVYGLLVERGLRPEIDIRLISCDNHTSWLSNLDPRPASIDPGVEQEGREAVRRVLARIEHPYDDPVVVMSTPKLVAGK